MTGVQFRRIAIIWLASSLIAIFFAYSAGYHEGGKAAEREITATKSAHDAEMAKLGLCEWPKAFAQQTHCPGY